MLCILFFFFNDTATTEIYTLSLHDALPILADRVAIAQRGQYLVDADHEGLLARSPGPPSESGRSSRSRTREDRKSTRLNSSHGYISYAVFCLKKKNKLLLKGSIQSTLTYT